MSAGPKVGIEAAIVAVVVILLIAGVICAAVRARRQVAVTLILASVLPFGIGLVGVLEARQQNFAVIETLAAPTPADLAGGVSRGLSSFALGVGATIVCGAAGAVALLRAPKSEGQGPVTS
jgi:hypothetical protein